MFALLKKMFNSTDHAEQPASTITADALAEELTRLEARLAENPADHASQKQLMVKYNQAIKVYAASREYRNRVDSVFEKMDELRNTIRRNL